MLGSFEKTMIETGLLSVREVLQAKAQSMGMPFVDLERTSIDVGAVSFVPREMAERLRAMPVKRVGSRLWIAMAEPCDIRAIDELSTASRCRVVPVVAVPEAIDGSIREHYEDDAD